MTDEEIKPEFDEQPAQGEEGAEQPCNAQPAEEQPAMPEPAEECQAQAQAEAAAAEACAEEEEEPQPTEVEIQVQSVNYAEFCARLGNYYEGLAKLIRIAKTKDDTIARLSRELQAYREDFSLKLLKPFCADLIELREDYRKTLREIDKYVKTPQEAVKYSGFVKSEIEDVLMNRGIELEGDQFFIDGQPLAYKQPRKATFVSPAETEAPQPAPAEYVCQKPSFDELLNFISNKNAALEAMLAESAVADANFAAYEKAVASLDDNYADALLLPMYKAAASLYSRIDGLCDELAQTVTEDNKVGMYASVLQLAIEGIDKMLISAGVTVISEISDTLDSTKDKILKVVACDDPEKDRKIAKRHTDCYVFNGKVLYPSKVDVYKFNK